MEVLVVEELKNITAKVDLEPDFLWTELKFWTEVGTIVVAVLGVGGNTLCFFAAPNLPESTTRYLIRYLAVWDSLAVIQNVMLPVVFYKLLSLALGFKVWHEDIALLKR